MLPPTEPLPEIEDGKLATSEDETESPEVESPTGPGGCEAMFKKLAVDCKTALEETALTSDVNGTEVESSGKVEG